MNRNGFSNFAFGPQLTWLNIDFGFDFNASVQSILTSIIIIKLISLFILKIHERYANILPFSISIRNKSRLNIGSSSFI
jgi:hypothetical protein